MLFFVLEEEAEGYIKWKFTIHPELNKSIDEVDIKFEYATYENGNVEVNVENDGSILQPLRKFDDLQRKPLLILNLALGSGSTKADVLKGKKSFEIVTKLTGGKGDVAWQHAQLFRQSLDSFDFNFTISITLRNMQ